MVIIHGNESWYMRAGIVGARIVVIALFFVFVIGAVHLYIKFLGRVSEQPFVAFCSILISLGLLYLIIWKVSERALRDYWNNLIGLRSENTALLELKQLPDEYHVFRNVQFDHGYDIDFVVVGPRGVFVLEVNSTRGDISADGDSLVINGKPMNGKDRVKQALRNTMEVNEYLDGKYFVQGSVVFAHYRTILNIGFRKICGVFVIKHQWIAKLLLEESDDQHLTHEQQCYAIDKLQLTMRS